MTRRDVREMLLVFAIGLAGLVACLGCAVAVSWFMYWTGWMT